jgi:hypothetical protein
MDRVNFGGKFDMARKKEPVSALVLAKIIERHSYLGRPVYPHDVAEYLPVARCVRSVRNDFKALVQTRKIKPIGKRKGFEPVHPNLWRLAA